MLLSWQHGAFDISGPFKTFKGSLWVDWTALHKVILYSEEENKTQGSRKGALSVAALAKHAFNSMYVCIIHVGTRRAWQNREEDKDASLKGSFA